MSSKRQGRIPNDAYFTPALIAEACVATLPPEAFWLDVLEPSCGDGAFVEPLFEKGVGAPVLMDLIDYGVPHTRVCNYLSDEALTDLSLICTRVGYSLIVGNPPFSLAEKFVRRSFELVATGGFIGFLLRIDFLGSRKRHPFFVKHPPYQVHILTTRPRFRGTSGTDVYNYAFVIWKEGFTGLPTLHWMDWKRAA